LRKGTSSRGFLVQLWGNNRLFSYQSVDGDIQNTNTNGDFEHDDKWHHFAMVYRYDGQDSIVKLYIDGEPASNTPERSYAGLPDLPIGSDKLIMGEQWTPEQYEYNGYMDELKFYNRALTPSAIQTLATEFGNPDDEYCGGPSSCFLAGTKISMADGSEKNIEDVKVGEYVMGKEGKAEVYKLESPLREGYYIVDLSDRTELRVTNEHPIYARNGKEEGWSSIIPEATYGDAKMDVGRLTEDSEVLTVDGWIDIENIEYFEGKVQTYNLKSVEGSTFYADGVLVHNKDLPQTDRYILVEHDPPVDG